MALGATILTWDQGWHEGNRPVIGAADFAAWLGNQVFDGARRFEGVTPDLDLHCARVVRSAATMGMESPVTPEEVAALAREGLARLPADLPVYIRPMMWTTEPGPAMLEADPAATRFVLCLEECPMPEPGDHRLTLSPYRRPRPDTALTEAKAASLYPNNSRILSEARNRGFHNAISLDTDGNVAETASSNLFFVQDGVVRTPVPNGTFLAGITRARVIGLLRAAGLEVREETLTPDDAAAADEIFLTANAAKVMPFTAYEGRSLDTTVGMRARRLYWEWAHG